MGLGTGVGTGLGGQRLRLVIHVSSAPLTSLCWLTTFRPAFVYLFICYHCLYVSRPFLITCMIPSRTLAMQFHFIPLLLIHSRYNYQQRIFQESESTSLQGGALQDCNNSTGVTPSEFNIL